MAERDVEDIFYNAKIKPSRIRLVKDQEGKFKGAAFVEFDSEDFAE
jgi:RNA recognition motif-containing protein